MPTFEVTAPNGSVRIIEAADEQSALQQAMSAAAAPGGPAAGGTTAPSSVGADVAKSGGIGLAKGTIGLGGLAGDVRSLVTAGLGKLGVAPETVQRALSAHPFGGALSLAPTSAELQQKVEGVTGEFYKPQTIAGEYAQTVGEFAPNLAFGPAGVGRRAVGQVLLPAAASETAGQAFKDTAFEPYARAVGGIAGGAAGARTIAPTATAAPTIEQTLAAAKQAYQAPDIAMVAIVPRSVERLADKIKTDLRGDRINDRLAPQTHALVDDLRYPVTPGSTFHRIEDLDTTRQLLGRLAGNLSNPIESAAASRAIKEIDDYLANLQQGDLIAGNAQAANAALTAGRANYAAAKAAERVAEKLSNAERQAASAHSGGNIDNATRQKLRTLLTSRKGQRGFTEDVAALEQAVRGSPTGNALRAAGNVLGGGGGLGALHSGAIGAGLGALLGGGPVAAAIGATIPPAIGYGVKRAGDAATRRHADAILQMILGRSPLGQSMGAGIRPPALPVATGGLLGGVLGSTDPRLLLDLTPTSP